jgi:two-component system OmpR family response regulator
MISVAPHILVVDDEPDVRELIRTYLVQEGYRVSTLGDGQGLRRVLAGQSVDLVILDLGLPGEDGLSLARYLREHSDVGVIIVGRPSRIIGLDSGADATWRSPSISGSYWRGCAACSGAPVTPRGRRRAR